MDLRGIYTALLTPFDEKDQVNETALRALVDFNIRLGVDGFYVGGSTAEAFLLTTQERRDIMRIVREAAGDRHLIAHIGSIHEAEAMELALYAKELGYDAISSVAPFYYKFSFEEIRNYYLRLARGSGMPMLVYHIPAFSGVNMGVSEIASFLQEDCFIGVKFTSNDFFTMEQIKSRFPDKLIFNGYDEMYLAGLSMGADGAIGSTYNFMADKFVEIGRRFRAGDVAGAQALQQEANRIITVLARVGVMQAEKEVLNQLGLDFGICRKPFGEPSAEDRELIAREIIPFVTRPEV